MKTIAENLQIIKDSTAAIKLAIIDKGGNVSGGLSSYADAISNLASGGGTLSSSDVNFYDYDGTILHSYIKDEFLALTSSPELPTKHGLICQGWNWTLEDAKSYVQYYGKLNIGATYITDDGKTRLYIKLLNDGMSIPLHIYQSTSKGVTVEWGDGNSETILGTGNVIFNHTYNEAGSYTILLTVNSGVCILLGSSSSNILGSKNTLAIGSLHKVEIGSNTKINSNAFYNCYSLQSITISNSVTIINSNAFLDCYSLQSITIPKTVTGISSYAFSSCYNLQSIIIPKSVTNIGGDAIELCYNLQSITIPNSVTSIGNYSLQHCYSLQSITIPNFVKSINSNTFCNCYSLRSLTIPKSVTRINSYAFSDCYSIQYYDFTSHTSIPTLSNTNAFNAISDGCEIRVPVVLYEDWVNATNWSSYVNYIVPTGSNIKYFIFNAGGQYKKQYFEDGMTWEQWLNSPYNRSNKTISDIITPITESDFIIEKSVYDLIYGVFIVDLEGNLLDPDTFTGTDGDVTGIGLFTDNGKWIVALDEWKSSSESTAWNGNIRSAWGGYNKTVTGCFLNSTKSKALLDFDGEVNTDAIIAQLKDTTDNYSTNYIGAPAAEYCRAYSKGHKGVGEWYLPAAGELNEIALNKDAINAVLTKLGKNSLSTNFYTWSSSQYSNIYAWYYLWNNSRLSYDYKYSNAGVRPICAF